MATNKTSDRSGLSARTMTWLLFVEMVLTLPAFFFLFQVIIFMPLIAIVFAMHHAMQKDPGFAILAGIHVVIEGPAYFFIARLISKKVTAIQSAKKRVRVSLAIYGVLLLPMFLPVYCGGGHGSVEYYSWFQTFSVFWK